MILSRGAKPPLDAAGCEQSSGHFLSRFSRCRHVVLQLKPSYNESRVIRHHPH